MFKKILIANRGEIAVRVIKTCRKLGIKTVVVYSDADAGSMAVEMADEAVHIGASAASESYLDADKIIAAVRETGAEAIHPVLGSCLKILILRAVLKKRRLHSLGPMRTPLRRWETKSAQRIWPPMRASRQYPVIWD